MRVGPRLLLAGAFSLAALACGLSMGAPPAQAATAARTVQVIMVPPYAGVNFTLNGVGYQSGANGSITVPDANLRGAATDLEVPQQNLSPILQVKLDRVANDPNHGAFSRLLVAELDVNRPVTIKLLNPKGAPLPPAAVTSVTLSDSLGGTTLVDRTALSGPIWLPASRPASIVNGVTGRTVAYSVKSVIMRGTNIVNSGQLRYTTRTLTWTIPVILHSLTIEGNDLLAGAPAGTSVQVTYPDGQKITVPLGSEHSVTISNLPRGDYKLKVNGGLYPLASTVRLSRDQTATELVVTGGDAAEIGAVVVAVLAILVAAGVVGRRLRQRAAEGGTPVKKRRGAHTAGRAAGA